MIKLLIILAVAALSIGTAYANCTFVNIVKDGKASTCSVCTDPVTGNQSWVCS